MSFELEPVDPPPTIHMKNCVKCGVEKLESMFRIYGKGRRSICTECETATSKETETPDVLNVKSSLGFALEIVNEDTYLITQMTVAKDLMTIRLQPHEAVALTDWIRARLYPEEE